MKCDEMIDEYKRIINKKYSDEEIEHFASYMKSQGIDRHVIKNILLLSCGDKDEREEG